MVQHIYRCKQQISSDFPIIRQLAINRKELAKKLTDLDVNDRVQKMYKFVDKIQECTPDEIKRSYITIHKLCVEISRLEGSSFAL